jgi:hypothetical protein
LEGIFKNDLPSGSCILHKVDGTTEEKDFEWYIILKYFFI